MTDRQLHIIDTEEPTKLEEAMLIACDCSNLLGGVEHIKALYTASPVEIAMARSSERFKAYAAWHIHLERERIKSEAVA